jgi:hypothetical protein
LWSFGFNKYGQLGLGHFDSNYHTTEPHRVCKFTGENSHFITDICATSKGSSFAVDEVGKLYRWGYNQVEETHMPIFDRFKTISNYQTGSVLYKNCSPTYIGYCLDYLAKAISTVRSSNWKSLTTNFLLLPRKEISLAGV